MLGRFRALFSPQEAPREALPDPERVRLATCVVLLEAARADEELTVEERERILGALRGRYSLSPEEADDLIRASAEARDASYDLWKFTHQINEACTPVEKVRILEEVWRVIYADGVLTGHEDHLVHKLARLLNLSHPRLIEAKLKVLEERRASS